MYTYLTTDMNHHWCWCESQHEHWLWLYTYDYICECLISQTSTMTLWKFDSRMCSIVLDTYIWPRNYTMCTIYCVMAFKILFDGKYIYKIVIVLLFFSVTRHSNSPTHLNPTWPRSYNDKSQLHLLPYYVSSLIS